MATTEQELLEEQILELVDNANDMTRSDLEGAIIALASNYQLIDDEPISKQEFETDHATNQKRGK